MSYSASSFTKMCENYIKTPEGQKLVAQRKKDIINGKISSVGTGVVSKTEMKRIANDLRNIVYREIRAAGIVSYDIANIVVQPPCETSDGKYKVELIFPGNALKRKSLWNGSSKYGGYTGNGVYDIIGLFVNGVYTNKKVWGYWAGHDNPDGGIGSATFREPNDLISRAVDIFLYKYADKGVSVTYPSLWGGTD